MAKLKKADRAGEKSHKPNKKAKLTDESAPPKATEFKGYDLRHLPTEALPVFGFEYKGQHSYTIHLGGAVS
jgi:hypothetical protein